MNIEIWYNQKELSYCLVAQDARPRMRLFLTKDSHMIDSFTAPDAESVKAMYDAKTKEHWMQQPESRAVPSLGM